MGDGQTRLACVPVSLERANAYVAALHRHHGATTGGRFAIGVVDPEGRVRGVVIVGRPIARLLDDGFTLEVNRLCTDGHPNACSALYAAAARAAKAMGYAKVITYILEVEPGTSLRAAGWTFEEPIRARSWNMPGRARVDKTAIVRRGRWGQVLGSVRPVIWPAAVDDGQGSLPLVAEAVKA